MDADAPLDAGLRSLRDADFLFVSAVGRVYGILTWTDVQKPPVRMWLFGLITLLESAFTSLIEAWHPDASWTELVSDGRLRKARAIAEERERLRGDSDQRLLDCLQLSDKGMSAVTSRDARLLASPRRRPASALRRLAGRTATYPQDIVTGAEMILSWPTPRRHPRPGERVPAARRARPRQDPGAPLVLIPGRK